jgi:signal transduction histidine kinase
VSDDRTRHRSGAVVALVGLVVLAVPFFDIYDDAVVQGKPLVTAVVENLPLVVLAGLTVAGGVWLARSGWEGRYARLTVGTVAGVAALISLVVFVQVQLQGEVRPLIIAADAVVIGALGSLAIGVRTAQQRRAVDDARRQRNRAAALFDNHTDAVAFITHEDGDPVVSDVNDTFEDVFGYDVDDIDDLGDLDAPEDSDATPVDEHIFDADGGAEKAAGGEGGDPAAVDALRQEVTRETRDGECEFIRQTVPVAATADPTRDAYVVYTDISEQKEREHQLEFLNSLLRHDIQNGMTVIRSRAEHLTETLGGRDAEFAATIEERSNDIVELTDRFRVMLGALTGDIEEELGPVRLDEVVAEQLSALTTSYPEVEVTTDVPALEVRADELLGNVVLNLLSNAVDHNDTETPEIEVAATDRGDTVELAIADDGPGIPDELKDAVFRRQESGVDNEVGSGFGLFFVDQMATRYGGDARVEDNQPRGTVFVLTLPKP